MRRYKESHYHLMVGQLVTSQCYNQSQGIRRGSKTFVGIRRYEERHYHLMVGQLVTSEGYYQSQGFF